MEKNKAHAFLFAIVLFGMLMHAFAAPIYSSGQGYLMTLAKVHFFSYLSIFLKEFSSKTTTKFQ